MADRDSECIFTHVIKDFSKIVNKKVLSDVFTSAGGKYKWQLLYFPRGNQVDDLSVYLQVADTQALPTGWCRSCEFQITLVNQDPKKNITKDGCFTFKEPTKDRGFSQLTDRRLKEILGSKAGYLVKDAITLQCKVTVTEDGVGSHESEEDIDPSRFSHFDSKKESGFVGLRNQGATCYLNSLMQAYFILTKFRRSVYQLPIEPDAKPTANIPLALQRLFLRLQTSSSPVSTSELTNSFGWSDDDAATQQDIQEFSRVLQDNLETKMKGTPEEGTIEHLFRGELYNYIKCTKVDFKSERREYYYDISLNVLGCNDLKASFKKYTEEETLDKNNLYNAGPKHGLQPAKKGILFNSFPPVLLLHLKRFDFDMAKQEHRKINDRHVFPPVLQLNEFLSPEADRTPDYLYHLHGVLVHSGGVHGGHYYAFLKPSTSPQWFRFDDSTVHKVSSQRAIDDNFGGIETTYNSYQQSKKSSNAYMLLYLLESKRAALLKPLEPTDIPAHLTQRFEDEKAEADRKFKEKAEEHMYMQVRVAVEADFGRFNGFDLVDFNSCRTLKVKKEQKLFEILPMIAKLLGVSESEIRVWDWKRRSNGSIRPDEPYVGIALERSCKDLLKHNELQIFVELSRFPAPSPPADPQDSSQAPVGETSSNRFVDTANKSVLFIKFYDPYQQRLNYIGKIECTQDERVFDLAPKVNALLDRELDLPLLFFEEVSTEYFDPLRPSQTLKSAELGVGDILTVQFPLTPGDHTVCRFPRAADYYKYMVGRSSITFKPFDNPTEPGFVMELQGEMPLVDVLTELGKHFSWNPNHIRLTPASTPTLPAMLPLQRGRAQRERITLKSALYSDSSVLFYELFSVDVEQLHNYRVFKVMWRNSVTDPVSKVIVCLKNGSYNYNAATADVLTELQAMGAKKDSPVKFSSSGEARLFQIFQHKIEREYLPGQSSGVPDSSNVQLVAEETPLDELELHPKDQKVFVTHYIAINNRLEAILNPFITILRHKESAIDLKKRIVERLGWGPEKLREIKLCKVTNNQPTYFKDDERPAEMNWPSSNTFLGIEHNPSNGSKKEKSVQIFG